MISIQEMTAWTTRDIEQAIHAARPPGWQFCLEVEGGIYTVAFTDAEGNDIWSREGIDERLILFDAYGWIQQRQLPRLNPVWQRKQREMHRPQVGPTSLSGVNFSDPADLDPAEIDAVYREHLSRRK